MATTAVNDKVNTNISAIYDRIYDIADRLFKMYNPCNIHTKDGIVYCTAYSNKTDNENRQKRRAFLCCSGCYYNAKINYSTINGCITKCLACKLHMCHCGKNLSVFAKRLDRLIKIACTYRLPVWRFYISKEDWLKQVEERRQ